MNRCAILIYFRVAIAIIFVLSPSGFASELLVPDEYSSIQSAINAASEGDTVIVSPGTYFENIVIGSSSVTLQSTNPNDSDIVASTIINGNQTGCVIRLSSVTDFLISGFTISNGKAHGAEKGGGGVYIKYSSGHVSNCIFSENNADKGGGVYIFNPTSSVSVENCTFNDNTAKYGAGMYIRPIASHPIMLSDCRVSDNTSSYGAGIYLEGSSSSLSINGCSLSGNKAISGGAIYNNESSPQVANCNFTGNNCSTTYNSTLCGGGGIYNSKNSSPTLTDCTFSSNKANDGANAANGNGDGESGGNGGGVYNYSLSSPTFINCTFSNNSAGDGGDGKVGITLYEGGRGGFGGSGGGMYNRSNSSPTLINCTFIDNSAGNGGDGGSDDYGDYGLSGGAGGNGGAICNAGGYTTIINCQFRENSSGNGGDGPFGNSSGGDGGNGGNGGAIINFNTSLNAVNCIFNNNYTGNGGNGDSSFRKAGDGGNGGNGGGMYNYLGTIELENCNLTGNYVGDGGNGGTMNKNGAEGLGDGMYNQDSSPLVTNCIVWQNSILNLGDSDPMVNYSCIQGGWQGEGNIDTDPLFADAVNNDFHLKSQTGRCEASIFTKLDTHKDNFIDLSDFAEFSRFWLQSKPDTPADLDKNGTVNEFDLQLLVGNFLMDYPKNQWVTDTVTSPCIDTGNPSSEWNEELSPNGQRINMGAYGNTNQSSLSP